MEPLEIGKAYDQITGRWEDDQFNRLNGIDQHKRAIAFVKESGNALDVGCGSTGRFIDLLISAGFTPEGVDVSNEMLKLAKVKHPNVKFYQQDICTWSAPKKYYFISAWDSIWHIPLNEQRNVITKLVSSLVKKGVLIFSFGGLDVASEHKNSAMGPEVYYSTLGVTGFLKLLLELECTVRHLEYDQYPEQHAYFIVQRN